jgi:hypothetical protein
MFTIEQFGKEFRPNAAMADIINWHDSGDGVFRMQFYGSDESVRPFEEAIREVLGPPDQESVRIPEEFQGTAWGSFRVWKDGGMRTAECRVDGDSNAVAATQHAISWRIARMIQAGNVHFMCERQAQ